MNRRAFLGNLASVALIPLAGFKAWTLGPAPVVKHIVDPDNPDCYITLQQYHEAMNLPQTMGPTRYVLNAAQREAWTACYGSDWMDAHTIRRHDKVG